ncbi:MAG: sulfurtransferase-like selenium metabolism protein YedF [Deltaproteobacteria bacterium]|nr:sulfurtransferase-like selenium metabolism protein YedF [Deltaproteobacteria bacterium]
MKEVNEVDARGLACPQPVLETRKALERGERELVVLADSVSSRDNVLRYAGSIGCRVDFTEVSPGQFRISIHRDNATPLPKAEVSCPAPAHTGTVIYFGTDQMGRGSQELGRKLMGGFIRTWIDIEPRPWRMLFVNSGVHLTTDGSEVLEAIQLLEERMVEVLSCGTCLEHFGLKEKLRVGRVTNMYEIIGTLNAAHRIITPD